jgi:bifunctional non-homologous end joining protein LigD
VNARPVGGGERERIVAGDGRASLLAELGAAAGNATMQVDGQAVALTHLDRVYWPASTDPRQAPITKRDLLRYLVDVAPLMLPHLRDRPLTLFRWPEGINGRRVLEKHWEMTLPPFVERVDVFSDSKGHRDQYILCNNLATLVWLAHMGTLEFHAWHSRIRTGTDAPGAGDDFASSAEALEASVLERPDYVLFDLDPFIYSGREAKGREPSFNRTAFARATDVARELEAMLAGIGLAAFVKTSGKTGLHVIVPIRRTLRFDAVREMARFIGDRLMRAHPQEITLDWEVKKRTGKVFVDVNMNVRGKSMTAPLSPRGLAGAPVSMPLSWRELDEANPLDFRITTVPALVKKRGDAWGGWLKKAQRVEDVLTRDIDAPGRACTEHHR